MKRSSRNLGVLLILITILLVSLSIFSIILKFSGDLIWVVMVGSLYIGVYLSISLSLQRSRLALLVYSTEFNYKSYVLNMFVILAGFFPILVGVTVLIVPAPGYGGVIDVLLIVVPLLVASAFLVLTAFYLHHRRVLGAGEAHANAINLLVNLERGPKNDQYLGKNFLRFVKGLDDWCLERLNLRIENLEEFQRKGLTLIAADYPKFRDTLMEKFDQSFFTLFDEHGVTENLSSAIRTMKEVFDIRLKFKVETFTSNTLRGIGTFGIIASVIGGIGTIINFILVFL